MREKRGVKINKWKLTVFHCLIPLFLGGIMYILFRSSGLRMFHWFSILGLDSLIYSLRSIFSPFKNYLPYWTYCSLPDGLWVYASTVALLVFWNGKLTFWVILPFLSGLFVEIAQGLHFFPGTFDTLDVLFYFFALILSVKIVLPKFTKNESSIL